MESNVDRDTVRLWRVHKTVHQMVHDRGYIVSQAELDMTLSEFVQTFGPSGTITDRSSLNFIVQKKDDPSDQLYIFFPEDLSVGVKPIRSYIERMNEQGVFRAIIIYRQTMTPSASKVLVQMAPKYIMEQFSELELVVNITEHELVPQHIVLNDQEKRELLSKYRLKETQLPRILISDPVAKYFGMRRGQVVKILRSSETAGRYITYRLAV